MHLVKRERPAGEPAQIVSIPNREQRSRGRIGGAVARLLGLAPAARKHPRQMRVVETLTIPGSQRLTLVSCSGERFLVGAGNDGVQTIVRVRPEKQQGRSLCAVRESL